MGMLVSSFLGILYLNMGLSHIKRGYIGGGFDLLSNSGVIWGFCGGMDAPPPIPHKKQGYIGGGVYYKQ